MHFLTADTLAVLAAALVQLALMVYAAWRQGPWQG